METDKNLHFGKVNDMKTMIFAFVLAALCTLSLTGCTVPVMTTTDTAAEPSPVSETAASELPAEFQGKTVLRMSAEMDRLYAPTMDNIVSHADGAIRGTVQGITYTSLGEASLGKNAWTVIRVKTEKTLAGDIPAGGTLDIYTFGGYIPLREKLGDSLEAHGSSMTEEGLDNSVVYQYSDESALPEIGKTYIFYLVEPNEAMPQGSYERLCGSYGQLEVGADGQTLTRVAADGAIEIYTPQQLTALNRTVK